MLRVLAISLLLLTPTQARSAPGQLIVVVDAGHGGTAKGAVGVHGVLEKRVALKAAQKLRLALGQLVGVKVVMTRSTDRYLTLSERVRRANRAGGHLFVSLHCNASKDHSQRGFEAFVLTPQGLERQARPLARGPITAQTALAGVQPRRLALSATLADLARRGLRRRAVIFGRAVITGLKHTLGATRSRGLRQAHFDVLKGLKMPGLLVEMGFIDHPVEGKLVATDRYLSRVVHSVTRAVRRYGKRYGHFSRRSAAKGLPNTKPNKKFRRRDRRHPEPTHKPRRPRKPAVALRDHRA